MTSSDYQHFDLTHDGKVAIIRLRESRVHDHQIIRELGLELEHLAKHESGLRVLFDLEGVEFLSSALLNRLIVLDRHIKAKHGALAFCNLRQELIELLSITKLNKLFHVFPSVDDAVAHLNKHSAKT